MLPFKLRMKVPIFILSLLFLINSKEAFGQDTLNDNPIKDQVLNCQTVKLTIHQMIESHYFYHNFNDELSQRTVRKIFENLDSEKLYFTIFDLNKFKELKLNLAEKIEKNDCDFLFQIYNTFKLRVKKRYLKAKNRLKKSIQISPQLQMETFKPSWARNENELEDRFKKNIFYDYLLLKKEDVSDPDKILINKYNDLEKRYLNLNTDQLYAILLNSFAQSLDPHSAYFLPKDKALFQSQTLSNEELVHSQTISVGKEKIGIIKIPSFYSDHKCINKLLNRCKGVAYDTSEILKSFSESKISGLIIDLRDNGGGDFQESIKLSSLFLPHGVIVQIVDKNKYISQQQTVNNAWLYKGPLVLLINNNTASASEIFASAIQDYARGIIVGDTHSYGKGTIQIIQELKLTDKKNLEGAIKITQNKFYRPSGKSIQKVGVNSDIVIDGLFSAFNLGENTLEYALPRDIIKSASGFKPLQTLDSVLLELKQLSKDRLSNNISYQDYLDEIDELKSEKNSYLSLKLENLDKLQKWKLSYEKPQKIEKNIGNNVQDNLISPRDFQLKEGLEIVRDFVNLSKGRTLWIDE